MRPVRSSTQAPRLALAAVAAAFLLAGTAVGARAQGTSIPSSSDTAVPGSTRSEGTPSGAPGSLEQDNNMGTAGTSPSPGPGTVPRRIGSTPALGTPGGDSMSSPGPGRGSSTGSGGAGPRGSIGGGEASNPSMSAPGMGFGVSGSSGPSGPTPAAPRN